MGQDMFKSIRDHLNAQNVYGRREVGLTHPDTSSFIRLRDDGAVEIFAGEEVSLVMHPSGTVTINADCIKFHTRSGGGLRWNKVAFNDRAVGFSEPTFIKVEDALDVKSVYRGVDYYTEGILPSSSFKFTDPVTGESLTLEEYAAQFRDDPEVTKSESNPKPNPNNLNEI